MGKYFENFEILYKYRVILLILSTFSFFMLISQDLKQNENTLFLFGFLFPFIGALFLYLCGIILVLPYRCPVLRELQ